MSLFAASRTCVTFVTSPQFFEAVPLPPAPVFAAVPVVRVMLTPLTGIADVAVTTVVPAVAEVIVTVQLAVAAPPVYVQVGEPTKLPGPDTIEAVAVCGPASIVPLIAVTVIVSTWFVPTGLFAVAGVIAIFAFTNVFTASAEFGATPFVCTVTDWPPIDSVDDA